MIRFQHIEYLWLLLLVPVFVLLYLAYLNWRNRKIKQMGRPELVRTLMKGKIPGRATTRLVFLCLSIAAAVFALSDLQAGGQVQKMERQGLDVFFALDVSNSMLARDVPPDRITSAKQLINRMIDQMQNDRTGLVVFAGKAYLQVPLTVDYSAFKLILSSVNPGMIPTQGTVLSNAIELANASFKEKDTKHKAIVLISDGEDHDSRAEEVTKKAQKDGVLLLTVGIGSAEGSTIYDPATGRDKVDRSGETVVTKLNEQELQRLASITGGSYVRLANVHKTADLLIDELSKMETKQLGEVVFTNYKSYYQYFLLASIAFLLLGWLLPAARPLKPKALTNNTTATTLLMLVCAFIPLSLSAQKKHAEPRKELIQGNKHYAQQEYDQAEKAYEQGRAKNPESYKAHFNLGDALYRKQQFEQARQAFQESVQVSQDKKEKARAMHNIGNTYLEEKKWEDAVQAYKNALRWDLGNPDTKYNLAYAQKMLKKEQKQQENNKDNNQQQNQDKDQDKQQEQKNDENKQDQNKQQQEDQKEQGENDKNKQPEKGEEEQPQRPQPQPSKLSQQEAENLLNALQQEEKKLHDQSKERDKGAPVQIEKDW